MPNIERVATEVTGTQSIQTELPTSHKTIFRESSTPINDSLRTRELARDMEPTAEVIGKMSELSFQKHGGADAGPITRRQ